MRRFWPVAPGVVDELLRPLQRHGIRLGLEPVRTLLRRLDDPHRQYPSVLVAGTNGKGSCAAGLASILGAAGYRAGLYTSPHLEHLGERIRVDGAATSDVELESAVRSVLEAGAQGPAPGPTWFEAMTAAAMLIFAQRELEVAVFEVGLGGRLDATNVTDPVVSIITPVALDHQEHLGPTLAAIAREKAGILRRGRSGVVWAENPEVRAAIEEVAAAIGAPLCRLPEQVHVDPVTGSGRDAPRVVIETRRASYLLEPALVGQHQLENLTLIVTAAEALAEAGFDRIDATAIEGGVRGCRWPGRLEQVALPGGRRALLDGAHNPAAAGRLAGHLETLGEPCDLLFGALEDKDAEAMLSVLAPVVHRIVLTTPPSTRARAPEELAALLPAIDCRVEPDPDRGMDVALAGTAPVLVVTGSLYLVGAARQMLRRRFGLPPPAAEVAVWERAVTAQPG